MSIVKTLLQLKNLGRHDPKSKIGKNDLEPKWEKQWNRLCVPCKGTKKFVWLRSGSVTTLGEQTSPQVHMSTNLCPVSSLGHRLSEAQENSIKKQKNVCTHEQRCSTKGQANFSTWHKKKEQRDAVKFVYVQALPDIQNCNAFFCFHHLRTGVYDRGSPSTVKSSLTGYHESIRIH